MKKIFSIFLAVILLLCIVMPAAAAPYSGNVIADSVLLIHADTGEVLYSKNETKKVYPAGTTKLMTALVAYELCSDMTKTFEIEAEALDDVTEGNDKTLDPMLCIGEVLTMKDILGGVLVGSGNDAAAVAAYCTAGSVEAFVSKMNEKAAAIGMTGTNFTNPHGRSGEDHYTTAQDMAKLISEIYKKPALVEILSLSEYTIQENDTTYERVIESGNLFYNGVTQKYANGRGSLGGYTDSAGGCLAACAEENGERLFCTIFGDYYADNTWTVAKNLFEYAFDLTVTYTAEELFGDIPLTAEKMILTPDFTGITVEVSKYFELSNFTVNLTAPADKDSDMGKAEYFAADGTLLASVPVKYEKIGPPLILKILKVLLIIIIVIVILLILAYIVLKAINTHREKERARRRAQREAMRAQRLEEESKPIDFSEFQD